MIITYNVENFFITISTFAILSYLLVIIFHNKSSLKMSPPIINQNHNWRICLELRSISFIMVIFWITASLSLIFSSERSRRQRLVQNFWQLSGDDVPTYIFTYVWFWYIYLTNLWLTLSNLSEILEITIKSFFQTNQRSLTKGYPLT